MIHVVKDSLRHRGYNRRTGEMLQIGVSELLNAGISSEKLLKILLRKLK